MCLPPSFQRSRALPKVLQSSARKRALKVHIGTPCHRIDPVAYYCIFPSRSLSFSEDHNSDGENLVQYRRDGQPYCYYSRDHVIPNSDSHGSWTHNDDNLGSLVSSSTNSIVCSPANESYGSGCSDRFSMATMHRKSITSDVAKTRAD